MNPLLISFFVTSIFGLVAVILSVLLYRSKRKNKRNHEEFQKKIAQNGHYKELPPERRQRHGEKL